MVVVAEGQVQAEQVPPLQVLLQVDAARVWLVIVLPETVQVLIASQVLVPHEVVVGVYEQVPPLQVPVAE